MESATRSAPPQALSSLGLISVLVPARDEERNIGLVIEKTLRCFETYGLQGELIIVDDGSRDGTRAVALSWAERYPEVTVITHRINLGLTAALRTGFRCTAGDVIVFLPGDMESDPEEDIPRLLGKMLEGYDVVAGWRKGRHDGKVVASRIYNWVSARLFNVQAHDMNWIKAFRRDVIEALPPLRSDWHRFLLMIAASQGFRIGEVETPYQPRRHGRSKYGFARIPISFLDVLVVKFLLMFSKKPMLFFGGLGASFVAAGGLMYLYLLIIWLDRGKQQRPLFWFAGVLGLAGLVLFLVGFVAELIVSQQERLEELEYSVERLAGASPNRPFADPRAGDDPHPRMSPSRPP
jgi:glycosyltransferase involved in cell wall biosynthesis